MRLSIPMLAFALLTAGFLWPTEEAVSGRGLHLVTLWMLLGMLHELQCWWNADDAGSRWPEFDWMDLGVLLIAVGHVISTLVVFQVEGDRRAAINLTFEWIGLLVAWRIFRAIFQDRQVAVQGIAVVVSLCVGLSCFGIWQHHVFYAEQQQWYRNLRSEFDQILAAPDSSQLSRFSEITREFQEHEIPMYGPSRIAWENRLLSSSEPFATFSLANTLAGILATGLVLLIGQASSTVVDPQEARRFKGSRLSQALLLFQICLLAYCVILTKSRSAWLGCLVGFGILLIRRIHLSAIQNLFRWLVAGSLIVATAVGIGVAVGGLDKEVILESPRSLQFRLLYWTGTLRMLQHQPFSGAGPGNFRQAYLQYKADETSEEIRDPHNFVLDAWSSSGLIGLSGLLLIIGSTGWRLMKGPPLLRVTEAATGQKLTTAQRRPLRIAVWGILGGFLLHFAWTWFNGSDEWISQPVRILLLAGVSLMISRGKASFRPVDATTCIAAATAMMVNLLAAGGFEMPAVMITLLLVLSTSIGFLPISGTSPGVRFFAKYRCLMSAAVGLALFVLVAKTGMFPVTAAENFIQSGNSMLNNAQFPARAMDQFLQARTSDPQSPTPRQRIAEVLSYRLLEAVTLRAAENAIIGTKSGFRNTDDGEIQKLADDALQACEDLIQADRRNSFSYRSRAEVRWNASLLYDDQELRNLAIQDLQTAADLYPSSVDALYRLAERLDSAGAEHVAAAQAAAARVLQMETVNRAWGHADRFLTEEQMARTKRIADE